MKLSYKIDIEAAQAHLISVQLTVDCSLQAGQEFWLPDWIPGSYLIRDFSKNITNIRAYEKDEAIQLNKVSKSRWKLNQGVESLTIKYRVYAWDLSVRSAHFDENHCFFNGTSIFFAVDGFESEVHHVSIVESKHSKSENWNVATSLPVGKVNKKGFGQYLAHSYEFLIDHPFEIANFQTVEFIVQNTPHRMVFTEALNNIDLPRIASDMQKICEYECSFFDDEKPPFDEYLFMTFVMKRGFGGLEHLSSTALHCSFADLPIIGDDPTIKSKDYQKFLSLCCHEYFHSWNVKRIKPKKFAPLLLHSEVNTELLWFFEGVTSYVDELFLVRAEVIEAKDYLDMLAKTISRYFKGSGRLNQSVADSSFDAWTKFYQQDENAPNAITSYYVKGALVTLLLDFEIREITVNQLKLDDLMQLVWQEHGKSGVGVDEKGIQLLCEQMLTQFLAQPVSLESFFQKHLYSTDEIELKSLFVKLGLEYLLIAESKQADSGGYIKDITSKLKNQQLSSSLSITHQTHALGASIKSVMNNGSGSSCGLSNKDIIIAINNIRVTSADLDSTIKQYPSGQVVKVSYFRRERLYHTNCLLTPSEPNTCYLSFTKSENLNDQNSLFKDWISA